ncbi:uncharacterized protein LOC115220518 isoform X2 [Octopus sinensis]|uniref:Uncharacterized protein LOC115220518 isoform X2 n=1 Tax=Octopus sinensis TaxID=2607531 RepID=A0A7E6FDL0_9MOLL|nr:uncharacterized protein LOC115220518 isoform X2 [Octopus sinensis]
MSSRKGKSRDGSKSRENAAAAERLADYTGVSTVLAGHSSGGAGYCSNLSVVGGNSTSNPNSAATSSITGSTIQNISCGASVICGTTLTTIAPSGSPDHEGSVSSSNPSPSGLETSREELPAGMDSATLKDNQKDLVKELNKAWNTFNF